MKVSSRSPTKVVAFRLPPHVYSVVERRAKKQKIKPSDYLRNLVSKDALRRR